jgi:hypothetical protein
LDRSLLIRRWVGVCTLGMAALAGSACRCDGSTGCVTRAPSIEGRAEATSDSVDAVGPVPESEDTRRDCRPELGPFVSGGAIGVPIGVEALADALGNGDGHVTGFELELIRQLDALPAGARCWLGSRLRSLATTRHPYGWRGIADTICGLDCGPDGRGHDDDLPVPHFAQVDCVVGVLLEREGDGRWQPHDRVVGVDGTINPHSMGFSHAPPTVSALAPFEADAERVGTELRRVDPHCEEVFERRLEDWRASLEAGRCPVDLVEFRNRELDDRHSEREWDCQQGRFYLAALDVLALRHCGVPADDDEAKQLLRFWRRLMNGISEVPLIAYSWGRDPPRYIELGEQLRLEGRLDPGDRVELMSHWAAVPLHLRWQELEEAWEAEPELAMAHRDVIDTALLLFLLETGRGDAAAELIEARSTWRQQGPLPARHEHPWRTFLRRLRRDCLPEVVRTQLEAADR